MSYKRTPEQREANRQAQLKWNAERRERREPHYNSIESYMIDWIEDQHPSRNMTDKHKENMSKAAKIRANTPESIASVIRTHTGRVDSPETTKRRSEAALGNQRSLGHRHPQSYKDGVALRQDGTGNSNWVSMSIYEYDSNRLVASNICLSKWCRDNNIKRSYMWMTANDKLSHYRNYRAEYDV